MLIFIYNIYKNSQTFNYNKRKKKKENMERKLDEEGMDNICALLFKLSILGR